MLNNPMPLILLLGAAILLTGASTRVAVGDI
jgi:hypothetical protein